MTGWVRDAALQKLHFRTHGKMLCRDRTPAVTRTRMTFKAWALIEAARKNANALGNRPEYCSQYARCLVILSATRSHPNP